MPAKFTTEQRIARFWSRVEITNLLSCWEWQSMKDRDGYGVYGKKHTRSHRYAWSLVYGPIPEGKYILHKCDNPACCNPNHLYLGTQANNMRDKVAHNRHPTKLTPDNIRTIRKLATTEATQASIARTFGVCSTTIHRIVTKKQWAHIT